MDGERVGLHTLLCDRVGDEPLGEGRALPRRDHPAGHVAAEHVNRGCSFEMPDGLACRAPALRGKTVCYWHDPDKAEEAAESRRIGGLHRRKAKSVAIIYDFSGLRTVESAQRLLETAAIETLALENRPS